MLRKSRPQAESDHRNLRCEKEDGTTESHKDQSGSIVSCNLESHEIVASYKVCVIRMCAKGQCRISSVTLGEVRREFPKLAVCPELMSNDNRSLEEGPTLCLSDEPDA
jgi:hypothetical protein